MRDLVLAAQHGAVLELGAQRDALLGANGGKHLAALWEACYPTARGAKKRREVAGHTSCAIHDALLAADGGAAGGQPEGEHLPALQ